MINPWYGSTQYFDRGTPQRWINILGTVTRPADVAALWWCLDHSERRPLRMGPDDLRLLRAGDFNVEVPVDALTDRRHTVQIGATLLDGSELVCPVDVVRDSAAVWPVPCELDLAAPDALRQVQVVEGIWDRTADGLRTRYAGYDRLLTVGDRTWSDYTVTARATIHGFLPTSSGRVRGGFGILTRWSGHRTDGNQPSREWRPNGMIGWYRARWEDMPARVRNLNLSDAVEQDVAVAETPPIELPLGVPHVYRMDVISRPERTASYRYRVWAGDESQPPICDLLADGRAGEAECGSVLLIALHADVTIHSVSIDHPVRRGVGPRTRASVGHVGIA